MNLKEQIAAFEARRAANDARMKSIMEAAGEGGRTLDESETEEFDNLGADNEAIDGHLKRLKMMLGSEERDAGTARAIGGGNEAEGTNSRGTAVIQVKAEEKLEPGIAFARLVKCIGVGNGSMIEAMSIAKNFYGETSSAFGVLKGFMERGQKLGWQGKVNKADVVGGATVSGNWAENLVGAESTAFADFVEYLRPQTIVGRFGSGGIPSLRRVPFRVALVSQTAKGAGYWVGEGQPKPLTSMNFGRTTLEPLKVANIAVLTEEVIRDSSPNADVLVRDELAAALRERIDLDFIDPAKTASAGVSPASITNGADTIAASGTGDADDVRLDIRSMFQKFLDANNPPSSAVLIMGSGTALALALMVNALGQPEFSAMSMTGGTLLGIPVITSDYVPDGIVAMVNAQDIYFADDGGISIDLSREASLQMLDNPTNNPLTPTATAMVSMFQTNSVAFRAERTLNWARRRSTAVTYLTGALWGGAVNT